MLDFIISYIRNFTIINNPNGFMLLLILAACGYCLAVITSPDHDTDTPSPTDKENRHD